MSTDWRRLRVSQEAAIRLAGFLAQADFEPVRNELKAVLGEWEVSAHTYAGKGGMHLVEYEPMPDNEMLVSESGRLERLGALRRHAVEIVTEYVRRLRMPCYTVTSTGDAGTATEGAV